MATDRVQLFFACFRKIDAHDPAGFTAAMISLLCRYPEQVVFRATSPTGPLATKNKYPPSLAEVAEFCEAEMKPLRDELRLAEGRRVLESVPRLSTMAERTETIDRACRERPELFSRRFLRERFGEQPEPYDETKMSRFRDAPLTVSRELRKQLSAEEQER